MPSLAAVENPRVIYIRLPASTLGSSVSVIPCLRIQPITDGMVPWYLTMKKIHCKWFAQFNPVLFKGQIYLYIGVYVYIFFAICYFVYTYEVN